MKFSHQTPWFEENLLRLQEPLFIRNFGVECPEVSILGTVMGESVPLSPTLQSSGLKLVIAETNRAFVADRLKIDPAIPIGVDDGTSVEISGIRFSGIASAHETWNEMSTAGRSTWDMFSNSAAGRFTTAVTPSDTKEWQKNCGPSEQTSRSFPLTDGRQNGAFRAIYSDAKRPSWQKTWRRNWSYRAISKCSNSIALRRTNSSTNAAS